MAIIWQIVVGCECRQLTQGGQGTDLQGEGQEQVYQGA